MVEDLRSGDVIRYSGAVDGFDFMEVLELKSNGWTWLTPKPKIGSLDEIYAREVIESFIPRRMPLQASRKLTDAFK